MSAPEAHFNELSPGQAERLAILLEECGEVVQICGKILRHGYESYHPKDYFETSNRELLRDEICDSVEYSRSPNKKRTSSTPNKAANRSRVET